MKNKMIIRGIFYKPETAFFKLDADKMAYRNIPDTLATKDEILCYLWTRKSNVLFIKAINIL